MGRVEIFCADCGFILNCVEGKNIMTFKSSSPDFGKNGGTLFAVQKALEAAIEVFGFCDVPMTVKVSNRTVLNWCKAKYPVKTAALRDTYRKVQGYISRCKDITFELHDRNLTKEFAEKAKK